MWWGGELGVDLMKGLENNLRYIPDFCHLEMMQIGRDRSGTQFTSKVVPVKLII